MVVKWKIFIAWKFIVWIILLDLQKHLPHWDLEFISTNINESLQNIMSIYSFI